MSMERDQERLARRPPVPERYRLHAPQLYPVWIPHWGDEGAWILVSRHFMAEFRAMNPYLPEDCFSEVPVEVMACAS